VVPTVAPTVAVIVDPVVRSHYIQRLARLGGIDERMALQLVTRGGTNRPRAVATPAEVRRARVERPVAPDGETQILRLLIQRTECRATGIQIDADLFEAPLNRAIFEHWRDERPIEDGDTADELDDVLRARHDELEAAPLPDFEPRHIEQMVATIATQLRLRRANVRLQAAALEQAEQLKATRTGIPIPGSEDADVPPDLDDLNGQLHETTQRQRALNREYQIASGARTPEAAEQPVEATEPPVEATEPPVEPVEASP